MLKASLKKRRDFVNVGKNGIRVFGVFFVLQAGYSSFSQPRVGYTATKKLGNAVIRNKSKRKMRHIAKQLQLQPQTDYVFIAKKALLESKWQKIEEDAKNVAKKAHILLKKQ